MGASVPDVDADGDVDVLGVVEPASPQAATTMARQVTRTGPILRIRKAIGTHRSRRFRRLTSSLMRVSTDS
jgi:hypothetical protein